MIRTLEQRQRRAAAIVETTIILSAVLLLLFGLFEYCRFVFLLQVTENAVRHGARYAVARTADGTTATDIINLVNATMAGRQKEINGYTVEVLNVNPDTGATISGANWNDAPFGGAIMVRVTGTYSPLLPSFLQTQASIPINIRSMMSSEAN